MLDVHFLPVPFSLTPPTRAMFFHRKPQNRRLAREYVLDVKLRSSQVRAVRMRRASIAGGVLFALVAGTFLLWQASHWVLDQFLYANPAFATRQIDLQTDGFIALDQLKAWAGVKPGDNLLALDLARVKHNLESVPFIQTVSVERVLPHTLRIRVSEREPIAQINVLRTRSGGGTEQLVFNLDAQAALIPPLDPKLCAQAPQQPAEQLPVIVGAKVLDARPGQHLQVPQIRDALDFLSSFDRSSMAALIDLRKIDAAAPGVLTVTTSQGSEITFATSAFDQQIRRWQMVQENCQSRSKAIGTLDLAVSKNVPMTWLEASLVPPITPKTPKALRAKKKHV